MIPVILRAGSLMGPGLAKLFSKNPKMLGELANKLRKGGASVAPNISSIVDYVKKNPMNATLVLGTLATMGVAIKDYFTDEETPPAEQAHIESIEQSARPALEMERYRTVADETVSKSLSPSVVEIERLAAEAKPAIRWLISQFGTRTGAIEALLALEYLMAIPSDTRRYLIESYRP